MNHKNAQYFLEMIGDFYNDDDNDIHLLLRKDQQSLTETRTL